MPEHPDVLRLRTEYAKRAQHVDKTDRYSLFNQSQLFMIQQRQRVILRCLHRNGFYPLKNKRILELGCGSGGVLLEILSFGAVAEGLYGVELLFDRIQTAQKNLSNLSLACADGQNLPYPKHFFDISMQFTVFSSILHNDVKVNVAREMLRVTRPGGMILWYDFWLNPTNPNTRGIRPAEIRHLFPNCEFHFKRITLAPPITRKLAPIAWGLCLFLESLKIFNTHYLATIRRLT